MSLIVSKPESAALTTNECLGSKNNEFRDKIETVLDNWRKCTPKQVAIAATLAGYYRPAEQASRKQEWNIEQALLNIEGEPESDGPELFGMQPRVPTRKLSQE